MKKALMIAGIVVVVLVVFVVIFYTALSRAAQKPPDNRPAVYISEVMPESDLPTLVCAGDSITHGRVSHNYVDLLAERLNGEVDVINAGINGELAWNLLARSDEIIACDPEYVTILIGTNDANGSMSEEKGRAQIKEMGLPQTPTKEWYKENLIALCEKLIAYTDAEIALLSLPPINEDIDHEAYARAMEYSLVIEEVADELDLAYLPLNETMDASLRGAGGNPAIGYEDQTKAMYIGIAKHFVLKKSFEEIADANGCLLITDTLHLSETGANIVADLIEEFVREHLPESDE
ncbi:MAG: SGNH/GDSL hydrolase family protein [Deltaproteobacteria bacterium]|nr:SGNH/GDSL hydrolase family protein [Candidatus Zymogenaceae bacterium]